MADVEIKIKMSSEQAQELLENVQQLSQDYSSDLYHVYCHFCGGHSRPYRTELVHHDDCQADNICRAIVLAIAEQETTGDGQDSMQA